MNTIPALAITVIGYYLYAQSGLKPFVFGSTYTFTYTINAIPVFPVAVILILPSVQKMQQPVYSRNHRRHSAVLAAGVLLVYSACRYVLRPGSGFPALTGCAHIFCRARFEKRACFFALHAKAQYIWKAKDKIGV